MAKRDLIVFNFCNTGISEIKIFPENEERQNSVKRFLFPNYEMYHMSLKILKTRYDIHTHHHTPKTPVSKLTSAVNNFSGKVDFTAWGKKKNYEII
jgi:hypothetical protein